MNPRSSETLVLKIGGSLFSDKSRPYSLRIKRLMEIGEELADALNERKAGLLVIHGGGSYGHYVASLHLEEKGGYDAEAFSLIADTMLELALTISDTLRASGLRTAVFSTHALWEQGSLRLEPLRQALRAGVVPVVYGDIIVDNGEIRILSGDLIAMQAAVGLRARQVYFASDVPGIFDADPRKPKARLLRRLCPWEAEELASRLGGGRGADVTGGISLKLRVMASIASSGIPSIFFSGLEQGSFYRALTGTLEQYSLVEPCKQGEDSGDT